MPDPTHFDTYAELRRTRALLRLCEWTRDGICPHCNVSVEDEWGGPRHHAPGCELGLYLDGLGDADA